MLISQDSNRDSLFRQLPAFQSVWPAGGWSWDNRSGCLASTISLGMAPQGWSAAKDLFPNIWDARSIATAPANVAKIASDTGGVRSGQFLLSTESVDGLLIFGLWWPWGEEGSNISMRIGLASNPSHDEILRFRHLLKVRDD